MSLKWVAERACKCLTTRRRKGRGVHKKRLKNGIWSENVTCIITNSSGKRNNKIYLIYLEDLIRNCLLIRKSKKF